MTAYELDTAKLWSAVATRMAIEADVLGRHLTAQELGRRLDFHGSTLTRLKQGAPVSAHVLISIMVWLGRDLREFAKTASRKENE